MIHIPKPKKRKPQAWGRKQDQKIYQSSRWRKERLYYLAENPICKHPGCDRSATIIDHVIPIREGGKVWKESNWQGLCRRHHNSKTAHESNK